MKPESTSIELRQPPPGEPWRDSEWQKMWLALQGRRWTSLAVCPAGTGVGVGFSLAVAIALARTGMTHLGAPIQVADGTGVQLSDVMDFAAEVKACSARGEQVLVALAPIAQSPIAVTLAQAADCVLLCALLEKMTSAEAKDTVNKIGKDRFLGTIVFRPELLDPR
jgi:hypothetical protein